MGVMKGSWRPKTEWSIQNGRHERFMEPENRVEPLKWAS